jgi:hypothetical protein
MDAALYDPDAHALAARICELDDHLDPRERLLLRRLLLASIDPLDRRRLFGTGLTEDQLEVLRAIEVEPECS